jgi:hypothetical protein
VPVQQTAQLVVTHVENDCRFGNKKVNLEVDNMTVNKIAFGNLEDCIET